MRRETHGDLYLQLGCVSVVDGFTAETLAERLQNKQPGY